MFHIFFSVNYWITKYIFKNREYPLFSTIAVVSLYQFFTLLFFYDIVFYQIYNRRDLVIDDSKIIGFLVFTVILLINYFYYIKSTRAKKIITNFNKLEMKVKFIYKSISIFVMLLIVFFTILMSYSIRNNIHWFKL